MCDASGPLSGGSLSRNLWVRKARGLSNSSDSLSCARTGRLAVSLKLARFLGETGRILIADTFDVLTLTGVNVKKKKKVVEDKVFRNGCKQECANRSTRSVIASVTFVRYRMAVCGNEFMTGVIAIESGTEHKEEDGKQALKAVLHSLQLFRPRATWGVMAHVACLYS